MYITLFIKYDFSSFSFYMIGFLDNLKTFCIKIALSMFFVFAPTILASEVTHANTNITLTKKSNPLSTGEFHSYTSSQLVSLPTNSMVRHLVYRELL